MEETGVRCQDAGAGALEDESWLHHWPRGRRNGSTGPGYANLDTSGEKLSPKLRGGCTEVQWFLLL